MNETAKNTNELLNHLIKIIEENSEVGKMEIFDKEKGIGYVVKLEPIEYDENGGAVNL